MSKTAKLYKAACSLNLAVLLRAVRIRTQVCSAKGRARL